MSRQNRLTKQMTSTPKNWIAEALKLEQAVLLGKLELARESIEHAPTKGGVVEDIWLEFFRRYLPSRYEVSSGFVVDHKGGISQQIDIIIFDRHYTPTLLSQERHRYIPVEAVYMVFEVKQEFAKDYIEYAEEKLASVVKLKRTSAPIVNMGEEQDPRESYKICGGLLATTGWATQNWEDKVTEYVSSLNCGCCLKSGAFYNFGTGNEFFPDADMALPHFTVNLLKQLNSLGTAPAVDWAKYAESIVPNT